MKFTMKTHACQIGYLCPMVCVWLQLADLCVCASDYQIKAISH